MDSAEALILESGFSATSIDAVVRAAGMTKGAFFHHFSSKSELGLALVSRYAAADEQHLVDALAAAEASSDDPVAQLLTFVRLLEESWAGLASPYPGCLFASYVSAAQLFNDDTHAIIRSAIEKWTDAVSERVVKAADARAPALDLDPEAIGDMVTVIFEGAFIVSKVKDDASTVARQLRQYRNYLALLFGAEADD